MPTTSAASLSPSPGPDAGLPSLPKPRLEAGYAALPGRFRVETLPTPVRQPRLVKVNRPLASAIGVDLAGLDDEQLASLFSGNALPEGARPVAMAYAGHQFGSFVPQLGDGRAILLGEAVDAAGRRRDVQLKGSGRTVFSRGGDGRAATGPVIREYIVSEAMAALGVPTTRALAAVTTGEPVMREDILPGAIVTRVASSHIRIGTFQFFAARGDTEALQILADFAIDRHYPELAGVPGRFLEFYRAVIAAQADLVARWMLIGFIHGVMNTDNMTVSGETIDYGPCAFMDAYHPQRVFSSIDRGGRYAYANQAGIAQWNLARLGETLLPLLEEDSEKAVKVAQEALEGFGPRFEQTFREGMRAKLGLMSDHEGDIALASELLEVMAVGEADFTLTFRRLSSDLEGISSEGARMLFKEPEAFDKWVERWLARLGQEPVPAVERKASMDAVNPLYIPRNHQIERAIQAAQRDDFEPFETLVDLLSRPFAEQEGREAYALPPRPDERVLRTFCGT